MIVSDISCIPYELELNRPFHNAKNDYYKGLKKEQQDILKEQEKIRTEQSSLFECQGNEYKEWTNCRGSYKAESGYVYNGLFIDGP